MQRAQTPAGALPDDVRRDIDERVCRPAAILAPQARVLSYPNPTLLLPMRCVDHMQGAGEVWVRRQAGQALGRGEWWVTGAQVSTHTTMDMGRVWHCGWPGAL